MPNLNLINQSPPRLRVWVRFADLKAAGIVNNRPQLDNMIEKQSFPQSRMLSPRIRAWDLAEVEAWLDSRPVGKVEGHDYGIIRKQRGRRAA